MKKRKITAIISLILILSICFATLAACDDGSVDNDGIDGIDGIDGVDGAPGIDGEDGKDGKDGAPGKDGLNGKDGEDGKDGESAYEIWLSLGNSGNEEDFINWLKAQDGTPGKDGQDGVPGKDGQDGAPGKDGADGQSAYEIWLGLGYDGSEIDFLSWLKGQDITPKINGSVGEPLKDMNMNGSYDIFMFGGYMMTSYNMHLTLADMIKAYSGINVDLTAMTMTAQSISGTYNPYDIFSDRNDVNDLTFNSFSSDLRKEQARVLKEDFLDCVIIQTGRDYSSYSAKHREYNINCVIKMVKLATNNNPNVKILLVGPYAHQANFIGMSGKGITSYGTHLPYIDEEVNEIQQAVLEAIPSCKIESISIGDLFARYSDDNEIMRTDLFCRDDGLNQHNNLGNRANSKGSYLAAAGIFAALTDASPIGLTSFGINDKGIDGIVQDTTALAMQKLVCQFVFDKSSDATVDIFYKNEVYNAKINALIAVADAYVRRGSMVQYDDTRIVCQGTNITPEYRGLYGIQSPELATEQNYVYTNCAAFINTIFHETFDYDIVSWFTSNFIDRTDMEVLSYSPSGNESMTQKALQIEKIKEELRPGDLIVYRYAGDTGGHIVMYVGNGKYVHSTPYNGGNYDYQKAVERFEAYGTVRYDSLDETLFDPDNQSRYLLNQHKYAVLRPVDIIDKAPTQNTVNRVNGMWGVVAQKLSDHPQGISANAGDSVTYTIKLQNKGSEKVYLNVKNTLDDNTSLITTSGQCNGNLLSWNVEVIAGETVELTYTVKIKDGVADGTAVGHGNATVNGVQLYCAEVFVKNTLTEEQRASIDSHVRANYSSLSSILEVADIAYNAAVQKDIAYDTNTAMFKDVFAVSVNNPEYLCIKSDANGVVQTVYGGWYVTKSSDLGKRTQVLQPHMMMEGDILLVSKDVSGTDCDTYLVLSGGELLAKGDNGLKILTQAERDSLFDGILAQYAFALLRPSYTA